MVGLFTPKRRKTWTVLIHKTQRSVVYLCFVHIIEYSDIHMHLFLGEILQEKKIIHNYDLSEKKFLISLMTETIDYAAQRDFNAFKLAALLTIYLDCHCYFKYYYWQTPVNVWNYFKEIMIRHTVEVNTYHTH